MIAVDMTQEAGERRRSARQSAEVINSDEGKLLYEAVKGRHGNGITIWWSAKITTDLLMFAGMSAIPGWYCDYNPQWRDGSE